MSFTYLESKGVPAGRNIRNRFISHCGAQWWETDKLDWVKLSPLRKQHRSTFSLSLWPKCVLPLWLFISVSPFHFLINSCPWSLFKAEMIPGPMRNPWGFPRSHFTYQLHALDLQQVDMATGDSPGKASLSDCKLKPKRGTRISEQIYDHFSTTL